MNTVYLQQVTLVVCGLFLISQLAILFQDSASSNVSIAFAKVKPQVSGQTTLPNIKSESGEHKKI